MEYRLRCAKPLARLAEPRERAFVVIEDSEADTSPEGGACAYLVAKRGISTPEAAVLLARLLGGRAHPLGLKDTRATTLQLICIQPCSPEAPRLLRVPGRLWARLAGRPASCRKTTLRGNRFHILLEPLPHATASEVADEAVTLARQRLPAYYSYQRFGTRRPSTQYAGLASLTAPHLAAVREVIDTGYPDEAPTALACRTRLWRAAGCDIARMYEASLSRRLPRSMGSLPGFLRSIHASALQALVFNAYLSTRLSLGYGLAERVPGERRARDGRPLAPVPGVGVKTRIGGAAGAILRQALESLGLEPRDLASRSPLLEKRLPYWRPVYATPRSTEVRVRGGKVLLSFWLEKGLYATLLLRELVDPYQL